MTAAAKHDPMLGPAPCVYCGEPVMNHERHFALDECKEAPTFVVRVAKAVKDAGHLEWYDLHATPTKAVTRPPVVTTQEKSAPPKRKAKAKDKKRRAPPAKGQRKKSDEWPI